MFVFCAWKVAQRRLGRFETGIGALGFHYCILWCYYGYGLLVSASSSVVGALVTMQIMDA